ncbi:MAG TPA: cysteine desulfurase family protein [Acidiphilium sp.]
MTRSAGTEPLYLDANATEILRPAARAALIEAFDLVGNPASVHAEGRAARRLLEASRETIAARFGTRAQDVVFCSGATEADAMAVHGLETGRPVLIGATEHDAIRASTPGAVVIPVDADGVADLEALAGLLDEHKGALVCLMAANNETGVIHPIGEAASLCAAHGALLHVDAVQAAGRIDCDYLALGAASMAISAHKIGGPKGAGALLLAPEAADRFVPLIRGGGQELGRRGGTQNLPAIAGFTAAIGADRTGEVERLTALCDAIENGARDAGAIVIAETAPRLPNTVCLALPGLSAETQVITLDLDGICVSAGSACSSGKVGRSHVLDAMGLGDLAGCAIRVSLSWSTPDDAPARFLAAYRRLAMRALRKRDGFSTPHAEQVRIEPAVS